MTEELLSAALAYARRGWYVFPCREKPGFPYIKDGVQIIPKEKTPYTPQGLNDATIDEDQIRAWWKNFPDALIGVNAGLSGLFVVDIDKKHVNGLDTYTTWDINDTAGLHSFTPSGGIHIVFQGNGKSTSNGKTGIDTRGQGGYFIAPPSKVLEGDFVGEYKTINDWGRTPGVIPDGLMAKLFPENTTEYVRGNYSQSEGTKQLSRATLTFLVNGAQEGERNSTLFRVLADFAGCGYSKEEARESVLPTAIRIGLSESEFVQVMEHAYSKPRTSSIPDAIQEKIMQSGKNVAGKITKEEQDVMELAVLSCMITDNHSIGVVADILNFEDFSNFKNRMIYRTINRMYSSGMKVDLITVSNELEKNTDKISLDYVSKMMHEYFVNTENAITYANIIKEKASVRKLESILDNKGKYLKARNLVEAINDVEKDIADVAIYGGVRSTNILDSEQAVDAVTEQIRKIRTGEIEQLKTGFIPYDKHIGGIYSSELVICAARAGDGKSALALSLLNHVVFVEKLPVVMFTMEMSIHETIARLVCQLTGLPFKDVYQGRLSEKEWIIQEEAMAKIASAPIYFDDTPRMTVPQLRSKIRKMKEKDIRLVIVDQLEQMSGYDGAPLYDQLNRITYDMKAMTKEFDVPILLNHQLNRNITDRRLKNPEPQLSDLNQAGEKPANQVWVISHYKNEKGEILQSKIKMLKNRNGARIEFPVMFLGSRMLFTNPSHQQDEHVVFNKNYNDRDTEADADIPF